MQFPLRTFQSSQNLAHRSKLTHLQRQRRTNPANSRSVAATFQNRPRLKVSALMAHLPEMDPDRVSEGATIYLREQKSFKKRPGSAPEEAHGAPIKGAAGTHQRKVVKMRAWFDCRSPPPVPTHTWWNSQIPLAVPFPSCCSRGNDRPARMVISRGRGHELFRRVWLPSDGRDYDD